MPTDPIILKYMDLFDLDSVPWNSSMQHGIEVDSVLWRSIIERLCTRLQPLAATAKAQGLDFRILGVKENSAPCVSPTGAGTMRLMQRSSELKKLRSTLFSRRQITDLCGRLYLWMVSRNWALPASRSFVLAIATIFAYSSLSASFGSSLSLST
jgi:hypothetical protein